MSFDPSQILAYLPMLILIGVGCVLLLAETFAVSESRQGLAWLGIGGCLAAGAAVVSQWSDAATPAVHFQGMLVVDRMSLYLDGAFIVAAVLTLLFSPPYLREQEFEFGEFYAMVLFGTAGMSMVAHATHLVSLLIGIETMSLAAYVLTGCWRRNLRSSEGAMKYFLMGAFATGFLVYGIALVYGTTGGELSYAGIASKVEAAAGDGGRMPAVFYFGEYFVLIALAFKVAAVPFHMWTPDAYEGAPTPVTGFMAAGVKAAAFGGLMRLLDVAFAHSSLVFDFTGWTNILLVLAIVTMVYGNLAAVRQENLKRLLAYSSIGHAGYLLLGLTALGVEHEVARQGVLATLAAKPAVLFYLLSYTFTTLGSFGVVAWIGNRQDERLFVDDWAGLGSRRPGVALAMTLFLLSLGGVPPTAGFFAKLYIFRAALEASNPSMMGAVVVGVLMSVVSIYYYLRIVVAMYFREPVRALAPTEGPSTKAAIFVAAVAVLLLGILPGTFVEWAMPAPPAPAAVASSSLAR